MSNHRVLRRQYEIIKVLNRLENLSKLEIIERLKNIDENFSCSERTLESDLETLRNNFGFDIAYNHNLKGYIINKDTEVFESFLKFIEFYAIIDIHNLGLEDFTAFKKIIITEDYSSFSGNKNIKLLISAIRNKKKVSFFKENFYNQKTQEERTYTVSPFCIKQYVGRWYLIALVDGKSQLYNFGLDRIEDLKIEDTRVVPPKDLDVLLKKYDNIIGLNNSNDKVEIVELQAHNDQIKYLKSLPLHHSQCCVMGNTSDWGKITYNVIPNREFLIQILKLGDMVKLIKPLWFRNDLKKMISTMNSYYIDS